MLRGLFVNTSEAQCSIYESGKMIYEALRLSEAYELDYIEVDELNRRISTLYDFYAFNYHFSVMSWLKTQCLRSLNGLKIVFVLEMLPNDPFVHCPEEDFDVYCVLDPTMQVKDDRVYSFPRPLEMLDSTPNEEPQNDIPIIGTFGFATIGKGFELVVDAVNKEFDKAIIRINIPRSTYADDVCWYLQRRNYAEYLKELCISLAKPGINVQVTHDYMSKPELVNWCAQNTLNVFLYHRYQAGLSATTDQAIASGRPLAVSTNETFRHLHQHLQPYPICSLKQSIKHSQPQVLRMQNLWSPMNFVSTFEKVLAKHPQTQESSKSNSEFFVLARKRQYINPKVMRLPKKAFSLARKLKKNFLQLVNNVPTGNEERDSLFEFQSSLNEVREHTVLFVSHKTRQCGIYQYGISVAKALQKSTRYSFVYAECSSIEELKNEIVHSNPSVIIYNYYPFTMPWLSREVTQLFRLPQLGVFHEVTQEAADELTQDLFDYHLCPDPTLVENNPFAFKTRRIIPPYLNSTYIQETVTIGSFGFGFPDKGFEHIVDVVQKEFDTARIRLNIPFHDTIKNPEGKDYALTVMESCRRRLYKPGISLEITNDFLHGAALLDFLAANTLNVFFYDVDKFKGISSCIELALAVQRPIALTKCGMFRHMLHTQPSIFIEDGISLKEVIANGIRPLVTFYNEWSEANFILDYESILDEVLGKKNSFSVGSSNDLKSKNLEVQPFLYNGYNRILDNHARKLYMPVTEQMFKLVPDMMSRKIQEANVQQAFVVDTVQKFFDPHAPSQKILCVGSYEDTAAETLKQLGFSMEEIDPAVNCDLDTFSKKDSTIEGSYDIIFSTSVLEHVEDDELFMVEIAKLLKPGGTAILTCDYNDQYKAGDPTPDVDYRFYTQNDLKHRLLPLLENCKLVDTPQWDCPNPDFVYAGYYRYTFATFVFQKLKV
jgi:hypothetical protein